MRSALALVALVLVGLFGATSIGYASYLVSRDSVGLPVSKLKLSPNQLAPTPTKRKAVKKKRKTTPAPRTGMPPQVTTTDDHGGRRPSSGSDDSGHGGDDD